MFSNPQRLATAIIAAGLITGLSACGDPVEPLGEGALKLNWQVGPHGCSTAGVESVEVRLDNAHRSPTERFDCEAGQALIEDIEPGNYDLSVGGLDADDDETFVSEPRRITIEAEKLNETSLVRLAAKPATVEVAWRFDNGRVCGANGVSTVEVSVYDTAFYELDRQQFSCDSGAGVLDELIAGDYVIEAFAEGDDAEFRGTADTSLKRGEEIILDVELEEL